MAGKKRAAKASATKRAATAAAKKSLQDEKQKKKAKIGSAARVDGEDKYHILKLIPIKQDECFARLNAKGIDCSGDACAEPQALGNAFTLKLPLNCQDIAEDFVDDYSSDNENTKQSKKPDFIRYYCPDNDSYSVVIRLGRYQLTERTQIRHEQMKALSKKLCYVGLTHNGEAWISMRQIPRNHLVHIDGKLIQESPGVKLFAIHNGTVLSFFNLQIAYRIEIESSVLANKKNALSKMEEVFTEYNKCCICKEPYSVDPDLADGAQNGADSGPRLPIKGKCGHDVCEGCLDTLHLYQSSGSVTRRYVKCPICNGKTFDIQNKVKDHLLCALIEARRPKFDSDGENYHEVAKKPATDGSQQVPSEVAMLRKEFETENSQLRKKICEIEKEKKRLKKRNEELEKLALENAQLRKRIEDQESKPKAAESADREMEDTDDLDIEDVEVIEVDVLSESVSVQQEHDPESNSTPNKSEKQEGPCPSKEANWWACSGCTFLNTSMRRKTCEICGKKRK